MTTFAIVGWLLAICGFVAWLLERRAHQETRTRARRVITDHRRKRSR